MHGVDWDAHDCYYRRFLPHINNNYDYAEMLSELLGELNVSHTGGRYYPDMKTEATAELGLLYDWDYTGDGLRIAEVIEKGPFDRKTTRAKVGTIIEKIDGESIQADQDYTSLLNDKVGKKILVSLYDPQTKEHWDEVVRPVSKGVLSDLLYQRWVKQRAADVEKWSNGRLGYVHMNRWTMEVSVRFIPIFWASTIIVKVSSSIHALTEADVCTKISRYYSAERNNFTQVVRGREACDMPSRRWNKPSIMVQCEANYSNAHGTPWVYKHRGLGKLVGAPVPGTMTSVNWVRMQDPTLVFGIPVVGYRLPDGSYLENAELDPDIYVLNAPETIVKGEDTQLKAAVDELLKEIDKK